MCNCKDWCRIPTEENGGKYPMSIHHPNCEDFEQFEYTRVELDGTVCVMDTIEATMLLADADEDYKVSSVFLTRDQFENLKEFEGF